MANNRSAIRNATKTLLSGETVALANVFTSRTSPLWQSELPAILIYTENEESVPESMRNNGRSIRTLQLTIQAKLEATETVDDDVDALVAEIETLITANHSLSGTVLATTLTSTEIRVEEEGEKQIGVGVLTYECKYIS